MPIEASAPPAELHARGALGWTAAAAYAREALGLLPTAKWALYTGFCTVRSLLASL